LEKIEQLGPRKGPLLDQLVGFFRLLRDASQLLLIDATPNLRRVALAKGGFRSMLLYRGIELGLVMRQLHDTDGLPRRDGDHQHRHEERDPMDRTLVIERPRGEICTQHYATRSRRTTPTAGASVSSRSGAAPMRSRIPAALRKSSGSTRTPIRSS